MSKPLDLHAIYVEYDNIHFLSGASVTAAWTKIARHVPALLAEIERLRSLVQPFTGNASAVGEALLAEFDRLYPPDGEP